MNALPCPTDRRLPARGTGRLAALAGWCLLAACGAEPTGVAQAVPDAADGAAADVASEDVAPDTGPVDTGPKGPVCGDDQVEGKEQCEPGTWTIRSCQTMGYAWGQLGCGDDCAYDVSQCGGVFGEEAKFGEPCGEEFNDCGSGLTCVLFTETNKDNGYCTTTCSDAKACPTSPPGATCAYKLQSGASICGFLCSEAQPQCPAGLNCTPSGDGGSPYCSPDPPPVCGNGKREFGEICDGNDLDNLSCEAFGHKSGELKCGNTCLYDHSTCSGEYLCAAIPPRECTDGPDCAKLELFVPKSDDAWLVTHGNAYSWLRRDTRMLVQHATSAVLCTLPGSWPLALGDMSMSDSDTPTTKSGIKRHPKGTHEAGLDIDIAYYQVNTANNYLRPVCPHLINGQKAYHCVGPPDILDAERSALFIARLLESPRVRVIGVDGKIGPLIAAAMKKLHDKKLIRTSAWQRFGPAVAWEETNGGAGWYLHHHHHLHLSTRQTTYGAPPPPPPPGLAVGPVPVDASPPGIVASPADLPVVRQWRR